MPTIPFLNPLVVTSYLYNSFSKDILHKQTLLKDTLETVTNIYLSKILETILFQKSQKGFFILKRKNNVKKSTEIK